MENTRVAWDNADKTILLQVFGGRWTWEDFYAAIEISQQMMDEVNHTVDLLVDMRASNHIPPGVVGQFKRVANVTYSNLGIRVVVMNTRLVKAMFQVFSSVFRSAGESYRIVNNLDDAYAAIENARHQRNSHTS